MFVRLDVGIWTVPLTPVVYETPSRVNVASGSAGRVDRCTHRDGNEMGDVDDVDDVGAVAAPAPTDPTDTAIRITAANREGDTTSDAHRGSFRLRVRHVMTPMRASGRSSAIPYSG